MKLISFDPGKTTGIVGTYGTDPENFLLDFVQELPWEERANIPDIILFYQPELIICESFIVRDDFTASALQGRTVFSERIIGWIEASANGIPIIFQTPSQRESKRNPVLSQHKQLVKGSNHIKDAYQHAKIYIIKKAFGRL